MKNLCVMRDHVIRDPAREASIMDQILYISKITFLKGSYSIKIGLIGMMHCKGVKFRSLFLHFKGPILNVNFRAERMVVFRLLLIL